MLVKDFNSHGRLIRSNEFMTNADMPAIATSSLGTVTNPVTGNEISSISKDDGIFIVEGPWQPSHHQKNRFIINTIWELKNKNIFEPESWVKVEKPE